MTEKVFEDNGTASVMLGDAHWHDGPGWYWVIDEYPDEGSCGAFETELEAREHAISAGYEVAPSTPRPEATAASRCTREIARARSPAAATEDDYWVCGTNLEDDGGTRSFGEDYVTREAAILGARAELHNVAEGQPFQVGKVAKTLGYPTSPLNAQDIVERAANSMHGVWVSGLCETWETKAREAAVDLQRRLDEVWKAWIKENKLRIGVLTLTDIEDRVMPKRST
jgi:hypothetical protein